MGNGNVVAIEKVEIAHIDFRYEHTRIRASRAVLRMADSMERFGQISPVLVVRENELGHILIDGYLRVQALRRLGQDMVSAQVWIGNESGALLYILARNQERNWDAYEQASLIKELHLNHKLSQMEISRLLGKDKSWVSRRLALLDSVPELIIVSVRACQISTWSANRILAPLERAMSAHA
ncbi:MAG: ParB/RepB/Spo0J family partition protein, partial [bacterium]|nr:ParB/RepB/Spo0J family partition protein [bacterium]